MKLLPSAFNGGPAEWTDAISELHEISLSQSLLGPVTYEGTTFEQVDFSGSTIRDSYFSRCTFRQCVFSESSFERVTLNQSTFEDCTGTTLVFGACSVANVTFDRCAVEHLQISSSRLDTTLVVDCTTMSIDVRDSPALGITIKATSLPLLNLSKCTSLALRLSDVRDLALSLDEVSGNVSLIDSVVIKFNTSNWANAVLAMKNSEVSEANFTDKDQSIEVRAMNSYLMGANLHKVDLVASTFISSALVRCEWPEQEGRTDWFGRFRPPGNLLTQPAGDVTGLSEATRSHIERSQRMLLLESKSHGSFVTLALHRFVGATTAHGRSPVRLIAFAAFLSISLAIANQSAQRFVKATKSLKGAGVLLRSILIDWPHFFVEMILIGNKKYDGLRPDLTLTASIIGVVLAGLLVTVLGNYLFRDS